MPRAALTIAGVLDELSRIDDELRLFVAPLTEEQAGWKPDAGRRWSIRQNIQHMAATNRLYLRAMRKGLRHARAGGDRDGDLSACLGPWGRWFLGILEPPPRIKAPAPWMIRPSSAGSLAEATAAFLDSQADARALTREAASYDLRCAFPNPFFGLLRVRLATGLLIVPAHDRRHMWQMRQVSKAPGFPALEQPGATQGLPRA